MKQPARPLLLLLVILALGLKPSRPTSAVGSNCLYECEGPICYDYSNHSDMCGEIRAKCQVKCSGQKSWGAIAYSAKDRGYGYSSGLVDLDQAKKEALDNCSKHGSACKLWAWYANSCGAIAADGNVVTWGTAPLKSNAEQRALAECKTVGGKKCAIEVSQCSR